MDENPNIPNKNKGKNSGAWPGQNMICIDSAPTAFQMS